MSCIKSGAPPEIARKIATKILAKIVIEEREKK